jgi:hypothetical protein
MKSLKSVKVGEDIKLEPPDDFEAVVCVKRKLEMDLLSDIKVEREMLDGGDIR